MAAHVREFVPTHRRPGPMPRVPPDPGQLRRQPVTVPYPGRTCLKVRDAPAGVLPLPPRSPKIVFNRLRSVFNRLRSVVIPLGETSAYTKKYRSSPYWGGCLAKFLELTGRPFFVRPITSPAPEASGPQWPGVRGTRGATGHTALSTFVARRHIVTLFRSQAITGCGYSRRMSPAPGKCLPSG